MAKAKTTLTIKTAPAPVLEEAVAPDDPWAVIESTLAGVIHSGGQRAKFIAALKTVTNADSPAPSEDSQEPEKFDNE